MKNLRRALSALLLLALLLTLLPARAFAAEPSAKFRFSDVKNPKKYYYAPVYWAYRAGIVSGVSKKTFAPGEVCTRAQLVTFLWRAAGCPKPPVTPVKQGAAKRFADVRRGAYYEKAVLWASAAGVVSGVDGTRFCPDDPCTRAQAVTLLHRALGSPSPTLPFRGFTDVRSGVYYEKAVLWAAEQGIVRGTGARRFDPRGDCTRAQAVSFLCRAMDPFADDYLADISALLSLPASPYAEHVYSHQGSCYEAVPQTFGAFDYALACGSRWLELDVVLSADGVLYCSHDATPKELTGETRPFSELTSAQIDALRTREGGYRLLRLSDVFGRYGAAVNYVIDLKAGSVLIEPYAAVLGAYGVEKRVITQSSSLRVLRQLRERFPKMRLLFLAYSQADYEQSLREPCVDIVCASGDRFTRECCEQTHAAGKEYCVGVVNSTEMISRAIGMGADSYITDYSARAFALEALLRGK